MSSVVGAKLKLSEILIIGFKGLGWDGDRGDRGQSLGLHHPLELSALKYRAVDDRASFPFSVLLHFIEFQMFVVTSMDVAQLLGIFSRTHKDYILSGNGPTHRTVVK
jgi:hypothetical protein